MANKIVVLNGSPRKNGNTARMIESFREKAEERGAQVIVFDAAMSNIGGCHACETCFKSGKACTMTISTQLLQISLMPMVLSLLVLPIGIHSQVKSRMRSISSILSVLAKKTLLGRSVGSSVVARKKILMSWMASVSRSIASQV